MISTVDALGREISLAAPSRRIVSLVPSITEALFAFGAGDRVVGATRFCAEPADGVRGLPKVGGTKDVEVQVVAGLAPDLVIANQEENSREDIERLIGSGLPVLVTYPRTVAAAIEELRTIAALTGSEDEATEIIEDAAGELRAAELLQDDPVPVFCPIWRNPWMTIGTDTYVHDMLRACGGRNVCADALERYPTVDLRTIRDLQPELVLLPDEPYHFRARHADEIVSALGAVRVTLVDGKDLCWYGPRIGPAIRSLGSLVRSKAAAQART